MLEQVKDYPVNLINWHDRESEFSLHIGKQLTNTAVCGGIKRKKQLLGDPDQVIAEVINTWEETDKSRTCIGTGCVIPVITPEVNIYAARKAMECVDHMTGLRIIGGKVRGFHLKVFLEIQRVRSQIWSKRHCSTSLGHDIEDAVFWDLFGGTGSVGIEALSRGQRLSFLVIRTGMRSIP